MRSPGADPAALAVVALGGALGSAARYGVAQVLPHDPAAGLPWATLTVNAVGCLLIGVLTVAVTEAFTVHRLVRPFLGVGVLGGFTTFSTWAVEVQRDLARGAYAAGLGYLALTLVVAFAAVAVGTAAARRVLNGRSAA
jgi:CrcB protein